MPTISEHIVEGDSANHQLTIEVTDETRKGGANHLETGRRAAVLRCHPLILALATASAAFAQGIVPTTGTWVNTLPGGYPFNPPGYQRLVYIPDLAASCAQPNYLTRGAGSEINDSLMCFDYAANRWTVIEQGGGPHSLHSFNGGHEISITDYYAVCHCLPLITDASYGNQSENVSDWWIMYMSGLTMRDGPLPTFSGTLTRTWLASGQLNMAAIDQAHGKLVIFNDYRQAGSGAGTASNCTLAANGVLTSCVATSTTGIPPAIINSGNEVYNSTNQLITFWGGGATASGTYTGGITATGTGTCLLAFTGGGTASVQVTAGTVGTALTFLTMGTNTTNPTTATVSTGTAGSCAGTATVNVSNYTPYNGSALVKVTTYDANADVWATATTTCVGADCVNGAYPPARQCAGLAYSPVDKLFVVMGGRDLTAGCSFASGVFYTDTWTYNPATFVWTELCNSCGYPNGSNTTSDNLAYDAGSNVFVFAGYGLGGPPPINPSTWVYAISTPLGYGRNTASYNPPFGSLNRTPPQPSSTLQGNAFDVSANVGGSPPQLIVAHAETGQPNDSVTPCRVPTGFAGSVSVSGVVTYYPSGTADLGCTASRYGQPNNQPQSHVWAVNSGGILYKLYEAHNYQPTLDGEVETHSFMDQYNASGWATGVNWLGGWPPMTCTSSMACSVGATSGLNLAGGTTYTVSLTPMPAGLATGQQVNISQGGGAGVGGELSQITVSGNNVTFTPNQAHTGAWTIAPGSAVPCWTAPCLATLNGSTDPKIYAYPAGIADNMGNPVATFIEQDGNASPHPHWVYVANYASGAWSLLGSGALNINRTADSQVTYASQPAADGSGNVAECWTEEINSTKTLLTTQPRLFCGYWNGSTWAFSGNLNITSTDWAYLPSAVFLGGSIYVAWTESTQSGILGVYVDKCSTSWSCSQIGSGPLNINASTGMAYHPTLATDGTNIYMAWEEQANVASYSLGYVKKWNGTSWSQIGSAISAGSSDSVRNMTMACVSSTPAVVFADLEYGNLTQVYARYWNGSTWAASTASSPTVPAIF